MQDHPFFETKSFLPLFLHSFQQQPHSSSYMLNHVEPCWYSLRFFIGFSKRIFHRWCTAQFESCRYSQRFPRRCHQPWCGRPTLDVSRRVSTSLDVSWRVTGAECPRPRCRSAAKGGVPNSVRSLEAAGRWAKLDTGDTWWYAGTRWNIVSLWFFYSVSWVNQRQCQSCKKVVGREKIDDIANNMKWPTMSWAEMCARFDSECVWLSLLENGALFSWTLLKRSRKWYRQNCLYSRKLDHHPTNVEQFEHNVEWLEWTNGFSENREKRNRDRGTSPDSPDPGQAGLVMILAKWFRCLGPWAMGDLPGVIDRNRSRMM